MRRALQGVVCRRRALSSLYRSMCMRPLRLSQSPAAMQLNRKFDKLACASCGGPKTEWACPGCGFPSHCSAKCHSVDLAHSSACGRLETIHRDVEQLHKMPQEQKAKLFAHPGPPSTAPDLTSFETFFQTRGFSEPPEGAAARTWSHVFTFPLTLASALRRLDLASDSSTLNIFIVGAHPEATVSAAAWKELRLQNPDARMRLFLIGPEVPAKLHGKAQIVDSRLSLHYVRGRFHEMSEAMKLPHPDMIACFNPGMGFKMDSPTESGARPWGPTIRHFLQDLKPHPIMLFTSFDRSDEDADLLFLRNMFTELSLKEENVQWLIKPQDNPFASQWLATDRENVNHVFASNARMYALRVQEKLAA